MGLWSATAANMLEMIGVGPFLTIPLILQAMAGPQAILGWMLGALIALSDGLVWAELGAAMPGSGGPYVYLREAYGPARWGRLMSFLFLWGTVIIAPLSIASGAVGFSQYLGYMWTDMTPWQAKGIAAAVCLAAMALLYRDTPWVGRLSLVLWVVVLATVAWVVVSGLRFFSWQRAFGDATSTAVVWSGLGQATLIAMYDYGGYFNVCLFAGEVSRPERTIPRSILYAIAAVATLYLIMNVTIIGVVPWREAMKSTAIVAEFIARLHGPGAAQVMTVLILWTTFASVFAVMLGYSRVPYAAAVKGEFFRPFARLHPKGQFPSFAVVSLGITSALACTLTLDALVKALMIFQILAQFLAQIVAVTLIRRYRPDIALPFRMWLYPLPSIVAFGGWVYILVSNGWTYLLAGLGLVALGAVAYLWWARQAAWWPFSAVPKEVGR